MHTAIIDALLEYEVHSPTHFLFNIEAAFHPSQEIEEERLSITPSVKLRHFTDKANGNRFVRLDAFKGLLTVNYHARVKLVAPPQPLHLEETPVTGLPDEVLHYLMPSRYCESDVLSRVAQQLFAACAPGSARVRAVEKWVNENIQYLPGASTSTTTAQEVFVQRTGVCRDFAHLGITLCRALNIPARLVVGYAHFDEPPQDFHAVFEAWLDGRWVLFDATQMAPTERLVRVGTGRDAKDVAFSSLFGSVQMVRKELRVIDGESSDSAAAMASALAAAPAHPAPAQPALPTPGAGEPAAGAAPAFVI